MRTPVEVDYPSVETVLDQVSELASEDSSQLLKIGKWLTRDEENDAYLAYEQFLDIKRRQKAMGKGAYMRQKTKSNRPAYFPIPFDEDSKDLMLLSLAGVIAHDAIDSAFLHTAFNMSTQGNDLFLVIIPAVGYSRQYIDSLMAYSIDVVETAFTQLKAMVDDVVEGDESVVEAEVV